MTAIETARRKAEKGERLTLQDALALYEDNDLPALADWARAAKERKSGRQVFYNVNRHINLTNICTSGCPLCAFQCEEGDARGYVLETEDIARILEKAKTVRNLGEIHIVSALHPTKDFSYYLQIIRQVKEALPDVDIKAFTPVEIVHFAQLTGRSVREVLSILKEAGLSSLPGGGAEILSDRVRKIICPKKATAAEWIETMKTAHRLGIRTNATMMYGHVETIQERIGHLVRIRELQAEKDPGHYGFITFIPWPFQDKGTVLSEKHGIKSSYTAPDYIRLIAVSRIMLHNIRNIQASLLTVGRETAIMSLNAGANDLGSIMIEENVVSAAGGGNRYDAESIQSVIREAGFNPVRRNQKYEPVGS